MHGELLARVLERDKLQRVLKRVRQNKGAPGIDGMRVDALAEHLRHHWLSIKADVLAGRYRPQPVRRVEIPKPDGRKRMLGFRPQRNAHQAVRQVQGDVRDGHGWVVDLPSSTLERQKVFAQPIESTTWPRNSDFLVMARLCVFIPG